MELHLTSTSAIPLSQYRNWGGQKVFDKQKYEEMFLKWTGRRNAYRIYLPVDAALNERRKIRVPKDINKAVVDAGFEVTDYIQGIITDKQKGTNRRLGKFLNKLKRPDLVKMFESDPLRKMHNPNRTKMLVVVSRHPYDIAGMSTGRAWRSCTNLEDGINKRYVIDDVKKGSLVAYLIRANDKNINNPIARTRILRYSDFENPKDFVLLPQGDVYGQNNVKFLPTLNKWLDKVNEASTVNFHEVDVDYTDGKAKSVITVKSEKDFKNIKDFFQSSIRFVGEEIFMKALRSDDPEIVKRAVEEGSFTENSENMLTDMIELGTGFDSSENMSIGRKILGNKTLGEEIKVLTAKTILHKQIMIDFIQYKPVSIPSMIEVFNHVKENKPNLYDTILRSRRNLYIDKDLAFALLENDVFSKLAFQIEDSIPVEFFKYIRRTSEIYEIIGRSGNKESSLELLDFMLAGKFAELEQDEDNFSGKDVGIYLANREHLRPIYLIEELENENSDFLKSEEAFAYLTQRVGDEAENAELMYKAIKSSGIGREYIKNFANDLTDESKAELQKQDPMALLHSYMYKPNGSVRNDMYYPEVTELVKSIDAYKLSPIIPHLMKQCIFSLQSLMVREPLLIILMDKTKELPEVEIDGLMYEVVNEIRKAKVLFIDERREMFLSLMLKPEYNEIFTVKIRCMMVSVLQHEANVLRYVVEPSENQGWVTGIRTFIDGNYSTKLWKAVIQKIDTINPILFKTMFTNGRSVDVQVLRALHETENLTFDIWKVMFKERIMDYGNISEYLNRYPFIAGLYLEQKEDVPVDEYMDYLEDFMFTIDSDKLEEMKESLPERAKDILESEPERYDLNV